MAASSPALSNNSNDTTTTTTTSAAHAVATTIPATTTTGTNSTSVQRSDAPKTLRGLNKPKCIQCGNVARSRCPYQSCKSCCAKAQNPCHIHVLKPNATFPDKSPSSTSPLFDQQSTEVSPSGTSLRVASLRQLSNNFAQFNNVQIPLRSRRPLTRKDAAAINEWRFAKLKEYKDRNIESENEAFDRYMLNISLLEEVCSVKTTLEGPTEDGSPISNPNLTSVEDNTGMTISGLKVKLRSNSIRIDNFRKRIQQIVDQGLRKLQSCELNNGVNDLNDQSEINKRPKKAKTWRAERASALTDLIDKLNKARNEEDLKSCLELKSQLFNRHTRASETRIEDVEIFKERTAKNDLAPRQESNYSLPKLFSTAEIDQETLNCIDVHFSSLEQIEDL